MASSQIQKVAVLGSSGSIGVNTLDVLARHPDRYEVFALAARSSVDTLYEQCQQFRPRYAVLTDDESAAVLAKRIAADTELHTEVLAGSTALEEVSSHSDVDIVMAAIVGSAGMASAMAAARAGKRLLLANKEALVTAGSLLMGAVEQSGAVLLPVDSEHNAIFQCLPVDDRARPQLAGVSGLILTASGGPFRGKTREFLAQVTPAQACAHPNWDMGRKISVDSASLMNKGLELAEACWLFDVPEHQVEVVVHPQSIVHSLVRYEDGSVLAQLGEPDMRTPIACCLAWPERVDGGVKALDLIDAARLDFEPPDMEAFPCLRVARECIASGGSAMAVCNAANEVAVAAFLDGQIGFVDIPSVIQESLAGLPLIEPESLAEVEEVDRQARAFARQYVNNQLQPGAAVRAGAVQR
ncbi:1-deoxy-D-xylulose-5-phosphate reductoisomerase [Congregibacter sp.]|uniref:1-deoxy-D-xylulose-5-phosphate reductoisomerase n=1 Tax=Congregibacter sp. TaxID=2744308 RepID=UPI00385E3D6A